MGLVDATVVWGTNGMVVVGKTTVCGLKGTTGGFVTGCCGAV